MKQPDGALQTCLLEVNDGYSLGVYPGISGKDYTDLLISRRWIFFRWRMQQHVKFNQMFSVCSFYDMIVLGLSKRCQRDD